MVVDQSLIDTEGAASHYGRDILARYGCVFCEALIPVFAVFGGHAGFG